MFGQLVQKDAAEMTPVDRYNDEVGFGAYADDELGYLARQLEESADRLEVLVIEMEPTIQALMDIQSDAEKDAEEYRTKARRIRALLSPEQLTLF